MIRDRFFTTRDRLIKEGKIHRPPSALDRSLSIPARPQISLRANRITMRNIEVSHQWQIPTGAKQPITSVMKDGEWEGQRCFILGGGPSLAGFDFSRLKDEKVIAVNRAFEFCPSATILFAMDTRFYRWIQKNEIPGILEKFQSFRGHKLWLDLLNFNYGPDIRFVKGLSGDGVSFSFERGIYHSTNSGYGAIQVALVLRASPIYLLGFDCLATTARTHFHSGYPQKSSAAAIMKFRETFLRLAKKLTPDRRIVNLNPASGILSFPFSTIDEVLYDQHIETP